MLVFGPGAPSIQRVSRDGEEIIIFFPGGGEGLFRGKFPCVGTLRSWASTRSGSWHGVRNPGTSPRAERFERESGVTGRLGCKVIECAEWGVGVGD